MHNFILIILFLLLSSAKIYALDVVYPPIKPFSTSAQSVFFHGSVKSDSVLKINSKTAKVWDNGVFVEVIPLNVGQNSIKVVEIQKNGAQQEKVFNIKRYNPSQSQKKQDIFIPKPNGMYLCAKTTKNNATIRQKASSSSKRLFDIQKDVVLYLSGKQGNYYKIEEFGDSEYWISKDNISTPSVVKERTYAQLKEQKEYTDSFYDYMRISLTRPVMHEFKQISDDKLKLTVFGVPKTNYSKNGNLEYVFQMKKPILGFDSYYQNNDLILKTAKIPKVNPSKPLKGIRIFVDAGHGGSQAGAIGPTRVAEKTINLAIAKKLIEILKAQGAIVSYSRNDDKFVGLYNRVESAKKNNALISVSIHNNSLPLGYNPYEKHGSGTYYYNENAKNLALIIKNNLTKDLNLKDDGMNYKSLALNRSTNPVSVLVEIAYMIHPEEYKKLRNDSFQAQAALSIKKSLEEYLKTIN